MIADSIEAAIRIARTPTGRPTLICCKTMIGFGSPNKGGTHDVHGAPLGSEEIANTRRQLEWPFAAFEVPADVRAGWNARVRGEAAEYAWEANFAAYRAAYPELAAEFERRMRGELPADWPEHVTLAARPMDDPDHCRRHAQGFAERHRSDFSAAARTAGGFGRPDRIKPDQLERHPACEPGGWRQLHPLRGTRIRHDRDRQRHCSAWRLHSLHGNFPGVLGLCAQCNPSAALMKLRQLMVYTHDSIGLGEDGPTHQPIEHAASLRLIPGLDVWRPADAIETAVAWSSGT
jgi:transketolase